MDKLLEELRQHPLVTLESLSSAVLEELRYEPFENKREVTQIVTLYQDGAQIGQHCVSRRKHFIKCLLVLTKQLAAHGSFEELQVLLRDVAWFRKSFAHAITLLCWEDLTSDNVHDVVRRLVPLFTFSATTATPILDLIADAHRVLQDQFQVAEILLLREDLIHSDEFSTNSETEFSELFNRSFPDLEETSILPAVLNFSHLEAVDEELLQTLPVISLSKKQPDAVWPKRVRFERADSEDRIDGEVEVDLVRRRDISVYRGYSILMSIMAAVYKDAAHRKMSLSSKRSSRLSLHREISASEHDESNEEFADAERKLRDLFPLEYRVEIMEDIFSLLFVRSSDLEEQFIYQDEINGEETDTESVRSWSSAARQIRDGFSCCRDALVLKMLRMLKNVAISTNAQRVHENGLESAVLFNTSVQRSEIHARLTALQQKLTDASWRLDLVMHPKEIPLSLNPGYTEDLLRPSFLTRQLEIRKSSKRRRHKKRRASTILKKHMDTSVIEKMLSSPASLLRICLHRGTFDLADQVLKIFALEDAEWVKEITFGELHYKNLSTKRTNQKSKTTLEDFVLPLSPSVVLDENHVSVLVAVDSAILRILSDFPTCRGKVKEATNSLQSLSVNFPTSKTMKLPEMRPFEEFLRTNLEMTVTLDLIPPFLKARPFHPMTMQSCNQLLHEFGSKIKQFLQLIAEPSKPGKTGMGLVKKMIQILRSPGVPPSGLLTLISGLNIPNDLQASRLNYLLSNYNFMKTYASCLNLEAESDNFDLMYQSPYYILRKMVTTGYDAEKVDGFIKKLSLDVPHMLLSGVSTGSLFRSSHHVCCESAIVLNSYVDPNKSFYGTADPVHLVATTLVNVLKLFDQLRDCIYEPRKVSWSAAVELFSGLSTLHTFQVSSDWNDDKRIVFLVNLYNLLFIHAILHAKLHTVEETAHFWEQNELATRMHFWRYRYQVGSLGNVSLQDLFDTLSPVRRTPASSKIDVQRRKESGFFLANSQHQGVVRVLYPEILSSQTALAVAEYLNKTVWWDSDKNILRLPAWLFQVYPSDQLYELVRTRWSNSEGCPINDQLILEPSRYIAVLSASTFHRERSVSDCGNIHGGPKKRRSAEAEDVPRSSVNLAITTKTPGLPLDELLPYIASACDHLYGLLAPNGHNSSLLPRFLDSSHLLNFLFSYHHGRISVDILCQIMSNAIRQGHDPNMLLNAPVVRFAVTTSASLQLVREIVLAVCVEKDLVANPWVSAMKIREYDLRMRVVLAAWRKWSVAANVDFFELVLVEDQRSVIKGLHIRVCNLKTLVHALHSDSHAWTDVFPHWTFDAVLNQVPLHDVEKRLEVQFRVFSALMLRMDQIEPLIAWLRQSEIASLSVYEEDLQLRGLVHMLDCKPPKILTAYQLLIPMLATSLHDRIQVLLATITSPEGRLPVIRIALMSGRFDETAAAQLKRKEVENLILRSLPDYMQKSLRHLEGHALLILEQLIIWNKLDQLAKILKIANLWDVFSRRMFEDMLIEYAKKAVEVMTSPSRSESVSSDGRRQRTEAADMAVGRKFLMPSFAPSKNEWTNDTNVIHCMTCGEKFGIFKRKHHCRRCGRVVCDSCSGQTIQVDLYGDAPVRACDDCFDQTIAMGSSVKSLKASGIIFAAPRMRSPNSVAESPGRALSPRGAFRDRLTSPTTSGDQQWLFTTDDVSNQRLRSEFCYAEAPDAALCIGLLKLHSSPLVAGRELLKIGNELSEWISSHSDCGLEHATLVSIMRTLFFNAKLFLHEDKDNIDWINVCDMYLNQLQLVELLLDAGATEIPSVQQLAELDTIRRVRDQLVQQERYALAIDLSTKAGLDPANVWLSWGRCMLKVGKFAEAQDKLSKCLKQPLDKNQLHPPSASALEEIMEVIQDARMPRRRGTFGADSIIDIVLHGDVLKPETVDPATIDHENFRKMTECLHYQESYGTHSSLLKFYMKRGLIQKALEYSLRENVSVEIFMDTVVMLSLRSGKLNVLEDELLMSDPSLNKWADYLTGICKLLTKRNMIYVLLSFQLFIKDYIRAATTCVMLFQTGPLINSYQGYFDRLHYLEEAQKHLLVYLESHITDPPSKIRLQMPVEEVRKYLKTIQLQVLVSQLLATKSKQEERRVSTSSSLPTLFGNSQAKTDVIALLVEHHNTPKADDYVLAIMETHGLNTEDVLVKVAAHATKEGLKGIRGILVTMKKQQILKDAQYDALVIRMVTQVGRTVVAAASKEWEDLIKQMSSDEKKVEAYVKAHKLKSAYLLAVHMQRADLVAFVADEVQRDGDATLHSICMRWLETNKKRKA